MSDRELMQQAIDCLQNACKTNSLTTEDVFNILQALQRGLELATIPLFPSTPKNPIPEFVPMPNTPCVPCSPWSSGRPSPLDNVWYLTSTAYGVCQPNNKVS